MKPWICIFFFTLCSVFLIGQEDPDIEIKAWEEMDSLKRYAMESTSAENYSFQIDNLNHNGQEYSIYYFCRVENNQLLLVDCSYSFFEKRDGEYLGEDSIEVYCYDSTSYSESYYFNKGEWVFCEQFLNEVYYEFPKNDSLNFQRYDAAPWSVHLSYYQGKLFSYYSNGHGLSETDEWEPEEYMVEIFNRHLKRIQSKYPEWR